MPKKKSGFPYEVHPTPAKGKDGRNIVYARPARGYKMSMKGVDEYSTFNASIKTALLVIIPSRKFIRELPIVKTTGFQ